MFGNRSDPIEIITYTMNRKDALERLKNAIDTFSQALGDSNRANEAQVNAIASLVAHYDRYIVEPTKVRFKNDRYGITEVKGTPDYQNYILGIRNLLNQAFKAFNNTEWTGDFKNLTNNFNSLVNAHAPFTKGRGLQNRINPLEFRYTYPEINRGPFFQAKNASTAVDSFEQSSDMEGGFRNT